MWRLRRFNVLAPLEPVVDRLVHERARRDALQRHRHGSFIASHLMGGALALGAVPIYLAFVGAPSAREAIAFSWLSMPLLIAFFLARTGRFELAHVLSALSFTGLVGSVAWWTGGLSSFVLGWLVIVPLEAALSGSRRVVIAAIIIAAGAVASLYLAAAMGVLPTPAASSLGSAALFVGAITAISYAGGIAVGLDASHQAAAELSRADEARYRLLAENVTDLITRHTRSGNVLFASPAAIAMAGAEPATLLGDGLFERVNVADRPTYLRAFSEAVARNATTTMEFRLRKDGTPGQPSWRWVEMRCRPAVERAEDGSIELVAVTRDIEERKVQEGALRAANDQAERANEAKSRFLANISHELRTPLNAIIGFSEMMTLPEFDQIGKVRRIEYAQLINESGRHLLDVVNGVLDMSKIESGLFDITPEPFDMCRLVTNAVATMQHAADKAGVMLVAELPVDAPEINADRRACKQILLNLLSNAVKFTDQGGRVTASLSFDERCAYVSVADTGIGISEEDLPRLATPFVQAQSSYDRRYEGTGLGLSVVKGLATLHGGELVIRSKLGQGTTVTVRLPIEGAADRSTVTLFPKRPDHRSEDERRASVA